MTIILDNYDSFTYNLVQYINELSEKVRVFYNDRITIDELKKLNFSHILISPGPGTPDNSGITMDVIEYFKESKSILGVCLGHQCIAGFFGADIIKSSYPCHGKTSKINILDNNYLFKNIPSGFTAARYHSLEVERNSFNKSGLIETAVTEDGVIMGLRHSNYKIFGVQFHPEAILTENGHKLLKNFLKV